MSVADNHLMSIFSAIVECASEAERSEYLDQLCREEPGLWARVQALLRAHEGAGRFLELSPDEAATATIQPFPAVGTAVAGRYKLMEMIGEGGMGTVWLAEQTEPVRRKVALKLIKLGMDTKEVIARFEAERQALALMDHPNISKVLDGGVTDQGRPYFVMELVRGIPITDYCDRARLGVRERLGLFLQICQAVQHAHQKGVIHRDLKPSNVLVTEHDAAPVAKVIDFGVAKAVGQQLTTNTIYTRFMQLVGTPLYMSPEQAEVSAVDVDTRSDVYSLGVILYELLTGTTPFDKERLKTAGQDEIRRIIREEDPAKPSTRLSTLGQAAVTVSANRGSDPAGLSRLCRRELDWIVMRALEKDRNRRYETVSAFAADLQRYLRDEPVQACPPSAGYRLRKFVRRNRGPVLAASLVVMAMVGGIIGTTWSLIRANDAEARAVNESGQKETALTERQAALTDARDQLYQSLVQQSRAERTSARVGQRFDALATIRRAAAMRVTPELRTEAIAALVRPDAEVIQEWAGWPEGTHTVVFDPNYRRYARMDRQGEITVCQVRDGREEVITRLSIRVKPVFGGLWMSPDGRYLAYSESVTPPTKAARMWVWKLDGPTPELLFEVPEGMREFAVSFHASRPLLAIGHSDNTVSVYDLSTAKRLQRLAVGVAPFHLNFHPRDGRLAVAGGLTVKLFDADTARELQTLRHTGENVSSVAWHPDGRRLATGCFDRKIHLWDAETATEFLPALEAPSGFGTFVSFNRAGDRLASGGWGGPSVLWDLASGRRLLTVPSIGGAFGPGDRIVGWRVSGNNIQLWGMTDSRELQVFSCRKSTSLPNLLQPVVDTSGRVLAASAGHWLNFYDLESGRELASARLLRADAARPVFFDAPRRLGSPNKDGTGEEHGGWVTAGLSAVYFWPARSDPVRPGVMSVGPPRQLAPDATRAGYSSGSGVSPDGRLVAVPQANATLVFDRDRPDWRLKLGPQYDVRRAAFSPDGRWVATCSHWSDNRSKSVRIWDAKSGRQVHEMLEGMSTAEFSPDGRWLMTSSDIGARLWDVDTWQEVRRFGWGTFAFSRNGLMAINDVSDGVRLIETTTGREVARLTGPDSGAYTPNCFTPDGTRFIATGPTGLYVWDLRLIRQQLKDLGLDWEWPDFPPADSSALTDNPLKVEVHLGELGKPNREQRVRDAIERHRKVVAAKPDDAMACNNLAWHYATAPEPLRDVKAAVPLAEHAVKLEPKNATFVNTLGTAYYRAGRYREAVEKLRSNLANQDDRGLAFDLYMLAMSHHRLDETARARDYFDWAIRWTRAQQGLTDSDLEELNEFRTEAKELLGIEDPKP